MADNTALPDPNAHVQALIRADPDELLDLWNLWYRNDADPAAGGPRGMDRDKYYTLSTGIRGVCD